MINWKQPTTWAVLAFIALAAGMLAFCEDASADTAMAIAPESMFVGGHRVDGSMLQFKERFGKKYEIALSVYTAIGASEPNASLKFQRIIGDGPFQLGLGFSAWKNQSIAWNSNFTFSLSMRYTWKNNVFLEYGHDSTSGSSPNNSGLDLLSVGRWF